MSNKMIDVRHLAGLLLLPFTPMAMSFSPALYWVLIMLKAPPPPPPKKGGKTNYSPFLFLSSLMFAPMF
jgi:hypothetical protein